MEVTLDRNYLYHTDAYVEMPVDHPTSEKEIDREWCSKNKPIDRSQDPNYLYKENSDICEDMVNHPEHYMKGGMETIEYLKAKSSKHGFETYLRLNAMKYLSRAEEKENTLQDLEKALWYLNRLIKEMKGN